MNLEYIGGHIWAAEEPGPDGYGKTIVSIEMEWGKQPHIVCVGRALTKAELNQLVVLVYEHTRDDPARQPNPG